MRARVSSIAVAAALVVVSVLPLEAQAPIQLKAGTAVGVGNPNNDAMYAIAKALDEKSKGRIKMDVVIGNGLAKGEAAHLEGAQIGSIDVVGIGAAPIGGMFEPTYQALDLPFFWTSREQVSKVMDGPIGQEVWDSMREKAGIRVLSSGAQGFRYVLTRAKAIKSLDDIKGQKIRIPEAETFLRTFRLLGANPVGVPFGETYLAVKNGVVDGL